MKLLNYFFLHYKKYKEHENGLDNIDNIDKFLSKFRLSCLLTDSVSIFYTDVSSDYLINGSFSQKSYKEYFNLIS